MLLRELFRRARCRKCKHLPLYHDFKTVYWAGGVLQLSTEAEEELGGGVFPWENCSHALPSGVERLGPIPSIKMDHKLQPHEGKQADIARLLETRRDDVLTKNKRQWNLDFPRLANIEIAGIVANPTIIAWTNRLITGIFLGSPIGIPSYSQGHDRVIMAFYGDIDEEDNNDFVATCQYFRELFIALEVMLEGRTVPAHYLMLLPGDTNTIVHHTNSGQLLDMYPYFTVIVHAVSVRNMNPIQLATNIVKLQQEMNDSETLTNIRYKLAQHDIIAPLVKKCIMYRRASSQKHRKDRGQQSSRLTRARPRTARRSCRSRDRGPRTRGSRGLQRSKTSADSRQRRSRPRRR